MKTYNITINGVTYTKGFFEMKKLFMEREMSAGEKVYVRIRSYSEADYGFYINKVG